MEIVYFSVFMNESLIDNDFTDNEFIDNESPIVIITKH